VLVLISKDNIKILSEVPGTPVCLHSFFMVKVWKLRITDL